MAAPTSNANAPVKPSPTESRPHMGRKADEAANFNNWIVDRQTALSVKADLAVSQLLEQTNMVQNGDTWARNRIEM